MLEHFYDYACEWGTSISDADMQCAFVFADIQERYADLWEELLNCEDAVTAGVLI